MKIAIAGFGVEGKSNFAYFSKLGHNITIADEREKLDDLPEGINTILGTGAFEKLQEFDVVVRTASLSPRRIQTDGVISSATNEFFDKCPAPIVGVTGSKGKGTIVSLTASILQAGGYTVRVVGNIGVPALDVLPSINPSDIVVYELSSFQLWDAMHSPHVAVVGMIEPDHLEVHQDMHEYVEAKSHIAAYQTHDDFVVFNSNNIHSKSIADRSIATKVPYPDQTFAHIENGAFWYNEQKLCSADAIRLPGMHNLENACAAIAASWKWVQDGATIAEGLSSFDGLPHRLKFVRTVKDVSYYDDSIATTPGSAIAALAAFWQQKILILGGSSKGADFTELAKKAAASRVKTVLIIGDEAANIAKSLDDERVTYEILGSDIRMDDIVRRAYELAEPQDIVVLSPACASFGMFENYADRGDQFIAAVKKL